MMRARHGGTEFLQQSLEVFLSRLDRMNGVPLLSHLATCHRYEVSLSDQSLHDATLWHLRWWDRDDFALLFFELVSA
jgi:hypothetical protein